MTMAFCGNCGTKFEDGAKFCPSCGTAASSAAAGTARTQATAPGAQVAQPGAQTPRYTAPVVPGAPAQADIRDANDNKTMAILAYILFFIPLLTGAHKTSPFVKYHTNQGTVLFIAAVAYSIAYGILSSILLAISWRLWIIGSILGWVSLVFLVLCILGIINAINGRMRPLPVIGGITIIK
jgi:uncharacterized membrane protein